MFRYIYLYVRKYVGWGKKNKISKSINFACELENQISILEAKYTKYEGQKRILTKVIEMTDIVNYSFYTVLEAYLWNSGALTDI